MMSRAEPDRRSKIINGVYNPLEAREILITIIDGLINFYKLQYLRQWEADHSTSPEYRDKNIEELLEKKRELIEFLEHAKKDGHNLSIEGLYELKLVKRA